MWKCGNVKIWKLKEHLYVAIISQFSYFPIFTFFSSFPRFSIFSPSHFLIFSVPIHSFSHLPCFIAAIAHSPPRPLSLSPRLLVSPSFLPRRYGTPFARLTTPTTWIRVHDIADCLISLNSNQNGSCHY